MGALAATARLGSGTSIGSASTRHVCADGSGSAWLHSFHVDRISDDLASDRECLQVASSEIAAVDTRLTVVRLTCSCSPAAGQELRVVYVAARLVSPRLDRPGPGTRSDFCSASTQFLEVPFDCVAPGARWPWCVRLNAQLGSAQVEWVQVEQESFFVVHVLMLAGGAGNHDEVVVRSDATSTAFDLNSVGEILHFVGLTFFRFSCAGQRPTLTPPGAVRRQLQAVVGWPREGMQTTQRAATGAATR